MTRVKHRKHIGKVGKSAPPQNTPTPEKRWLRYTMGEEIFNSVSHGVGAIFALVGGGIIVTLAAVYGDIRSIVACTIYAVSLCLLYTMSTLYHAFPFPKVKELFRIFDHSSVYVLIAGTYTPFMLITLQESTKGLVIFIVNWLAAVLGITLSSINLKKFSKISLILYLVMGWSVVFAMADVVQNMARGGLILLMLGGVMYTVGVIFYLLKKVRYMHSIWHLFVLAGSVLHYVCIAVYVI